MCVHFDRFCWDLWVLFCFFPLELSNISKMGIWQMISELMEEKLLLSLHVFNKTSASSTANLALRRQQQMVSQSSG